jgi:hypothetical protein
LIIILPAALKITNTKDRKIGVLPKRKKCLRITSIRTLAQIKTFMLTIERMTHQHETTKVSAMKNIKSLLFSIFCQQNSKNKYANTPISYWEDESSLSNL